jgi:hypothetical protein
MHHMEAFIVNEKHEKYIIKTESVYEKIIHNDKNG